MRKVLDWKKKATPSVAEALLVRDECPSLLFAITGPTSYKALDWGRDVYLIGRGNQITERGLLLRFLLDDRQIGAFSTGDVEVWNPFRLSLKEKLFFLYHLTEIDGVIFELLLMLGERGHEEDALESADAARLTCRALLSVLKRTQHKVPPAEVLRFRTASALAATVIAEELDMLGEAHDLVGADSTEDA